MVENILIHDSDNTSFPNLALMKISAWHKNKGNSIDWFSPITWNGEKVYSSKVFTFTKESLYLPLQTNKGGIGYGLKDSLPEDIEHICPDYDLYGINYSIGFLTRGCSRNCQWCFVPEKEGKTRPHADIEEFARHKNVVLMDNNVLSHDHGIDQLEKISKLDLKVDFNQGLDSRLIDNYVAKRLSKIKWLSPIRLACDHKVQIESVRKAVELLRWHNATPRRYFCYVLIKDIDDAVERIRFLKGIDVDAFAMPFIDKNGCKPTFEQRCLARWVNHKAEWKSQTWEEYYKRVNTHV